MLELPVTALHAHLDPTVAFEQPPVGCAVRTIHSWESMERCVERTLH